MNKPIIEVVPTAEMQMFTNGPMAVRCNVVIIQNAGNTLVTLDDGWDLRPGEKISFGNYEWNVIIRHTFSVRFGTTSLIPDEEPNPLAQFYTMRAANFHQLSDYEDISNQ